MTGTPQRLREGVITDETAPVVLQQLLELLGDRPFTTYSKAESTFNPRIHRLDATVAAPVTTERGFEGRLGIRLNVVGADRYIDILNAWYSYGAVQFRFYDNCFEIAATYGEVQHVTVVLALQAPHYQPASSSPAQVQPLVNALLSYHNAHNGEITGETAAEYGSRLAAAMIGREVLYIVPGTDGSLNRPKHLVVTGVWVAQADDTRLYIEFNEGVYGLPSAHLFLLRYNSCVQEPWPQTWLNSYDDGSIVLTAVGLEYARMNHLYYPLPAASG